MNEQRAHEQLEKFWVEMDKVVIGRKKEFKLLVMALLTEGHVLFEDLPGTGKTTMVKAFARGLACDFARVQCTPDLLPSDIVGGSVFNPKLNDIELREGPVFTNVLLVDEINRALPRTQSSLLECMEERQVTIEGETYPLESPFIVLATQNPVDSEGTFPLPEAQMDRFLIKLKLGYPTAEEEEEMLARVGDEIHYEDIKNIFHPEIIKRLQNESKQVDVHPAIRQYLTKLAQETRQHPQISIGVSPRASKALFRAIKSWALLNGRTYVIPDDVKEMALPVWSHRIILKMEVKMNEMKAEDVLQQLLDQIPIPEEQVVRL